MELRDALTQIAEIRTRVAETERFRGYHAVPVAVSGVAAAVAGFVQTRLRVDPVSNLGDYLTIWVSAAAIAALLPGLWQVFFSLGVFASCRLLPKAVALIGVFHLVAGL